MLTRNRLTLFREKATKRQYPNGSSSKDETGLQLESHRQHQGTNEQNRVDIWERNPTQRDLEVQPW